MIDQARRALDEADRRRQRGVLTAPVPMDEEPSRITHRPMDLDEEAPRSGRATVHEDEWELAGTLF
jgi:hypothetical protein